MVAKYRKEIKERTFWRQTSHKWRGCKHHASPVVHRGHFLLRGNITSREWRKGTLCVPKLTSTWFSLNTSSSSKFSGTAAVFLVVPLLGTTHLPYAGRDFLPITWFPRDSRCWHPLCPTQQLARCSWQGSGLYSYLLYRVVSQTLKLYKLLPQPGIRQKEMERWRSSSGCTRNRAATSSQQGPGSKAARAIQLPHLAPYLENPHLFTQRNTKHPNRRNKPVIQKITQIRFLRILMLYLLVQKHQLYCLLRKPLLKQTHEK